jgi:hypothetical protein
VRITRTAISPRLATRTVSNILLTSGFLYRKPGGAAGLSVPKAQAHMRKTP